MTTTGALDDDLQAISLKMARGQPLTAAEQTRWYNHLSTSGALVGRATQPTDFAPPGARVGETGGLIPDQGSALPAAPVQPDAFELGRRDRGQADNYYAGVTGAPRPGAVAVTASPDNPMTPTTTRIGERNPFARKPGSGQGTIRRGGEVYAYNDGAAVTGERGVRRVFADENAAMDHLDTLRRPATAAPATPASVTTPPPAPKPAAPTPEPVAPTPEPNPPVAPPAGPSTFENYGAAGVVAKTVANTFQGGGSALSYVPPAMEGAVEGLIGKRGVAALDRLRLPPPRPEDMRRIAGGLGLGMMPLPPLPREVPLGRPEDNPMTRAAAVPMGNQNENPMTLTPPKRSRPKPKRYQSYADRFNPFSTSNRPFTLAPSVE